jgi:glutamate--cysteine ligase
VSGPAPETSESQTPIESRDQLAAYLEAGCKPREQWRIGTEHEKFAFLTDTLKPVPYDGPRSIKALLEGLRDRFAWTPIIEKDNIIGLIEPETGGSISLEPGGQFELSGAPLKTCKTPARRCTSISPRCARLAMRWVSAFSAWAFRRCGPAMKPR